MKAIIKITVRITNNFKGVYNMPLLVPNPITHKEIMIFLSSYYKYNNFISYNELMQFFNKSYKLSMCRNKISSLISDGYIERTEHKIDKLYKVIKID